MLLNGQSGESLQSITFEELWITAFEIVFLGVIENCPAKFLSAPNVYKFIHHNAANSIHFTQPLVEFQQFLFPAGNEFVIYKEFRVGCVNRNAPLDVSRLEILRMSFRESLLGDFLEVVLCAENQVARR